MCASEKREIASSFGKSPLCLAPLGLPPERSTMEEADVNPGEKRQRVGKVVNLQEEFSPELLRMYVVPSRLLRRPRPPAQPVDRV